MSIDTLAGIRRRASGCHLVLLILFSGLLLSACSNQFIYDRIDRIAQFYIERYVDLDREQSAFLKVNLQSIKEWHRREELQRYRRFLHQVESDLQADVTAETINGWVEQLRQAYNAVRDRVLPTMLTMAQTLTDNQIRELAANMEKRNRELEKEYLSRDESEYRDSAYDEMRERLGDWLGRLTPEQKQRLRSAVNGLERQDRAWLEARRSWQHEVIRELQKKPGWQSRLTALIKNRNEYNAAKDIAANQRNEQRIYAAVADVLNMRTDGQRRKLTEKLHDWQKDLADLQDYRRKSG